MQWIILVIAGLFEVGFAVCLGKAQNSSGNTSFFWYSGFAFCLCISMVLLIKAAQTIPIGTAYVVWTGIGAIGTVALGIFFLHEPATFWRIFFMLTLIASIIGLRWVSV